MLYSDGVADAQDAAGEEFGEDQLTEILRDAKGLAAEAIVERVFAAIDAFSGDAPQFDDITLLVLGGSSERGYAPAVAALAARRPPIRRRMRPSALRSVPR